VPSAFGGVGADVVDDDDDKADRSCDRQSDQPVGITTRRGDCGMGM